MTPEAELARLVALSRVDDLRSRLRDAQHRRDAAKVTGLRRELAEAQTHLATVRRRRTTS